MVPSSRSARRGPTPNHPTRRRRHRPRRTTPRKGFPVACGRRSARGETAARPEPGKSGFGPGSEFRTTTVPVDEGVERKHGILSVVSWGCLSVTSKIWSQQQPCEGGGARAIRWGSRRFRRYPWHKQCEQKVENVGGKLSERDEITQHVVSLHRCNLSVPVWSRTGRAESADGGQHVVLCRLPSAVGTVRKRHKNDLSPPPPLPIRRLGSTGAPPHGTGEVSAVRQHDVLGNPITHGKPSEKH